MRILLIIDYKTVKRIRRMFTRWGNERIMLIGCMDPFRGRWAVLSPSRDKLKKCHQQCTFPSNLQVTNGLMKNFLASFVPSICEGVRFQSSSFVQTREPYKLVAIKSGKIIQRGSLNYRLVDCDTTSRVAAVALLFDWWYSVLLTLCKGERREEEDGWPSLRVKVDGEEAIKGRRERENSFSLQSAPLID